MKERKRMSFRLDDYETVADRITRLLTAHPDARIVTEDLTTLEDRSVSTWRVKAYVYLTAGDQAEDLPKATGHAFEIDGGKGANQTAAWENAETSAIGRAIAHALAGYSGDKKASRTEMEKVQRGATPQPTGATPRPRRDWKAEAEAITDVDALRALFNEATAARADKASLEAIKKAGTRLAVK